MSQKVEMACDWGWGGGGVTPSTLERLEIAVSLSNVPRHT